VLEKLDFALIHNTKEQTFRVWSVLKDGNQLGYVQCVHEQFVFRTLSGRFDFSKEDLRQIADFVESAGRR
jgi:hypothetical protein